VLYERGHEQEAVFLKIYLLENREIIHQVVNDVLESLHEGHCKGAVLAQHPDDVPALVYHQLITERTF
jgi:hypothetical protein